MHKLQNLSIYRFRKFYHRTITTRVDLKVLLWLGRVSARETTKTTA